MVNILTNYQNIYIQIIKQFIPGLKNRITLTILHIDTLKAFESFSFG